MEWPIMNSIKASLRIFFLNLIKKSIKSRLDCSSHTCCGWTWYLSTSPTPLSISLFLSIHNTHFTTIHNTQYIYVYYTCFFWLLLLHSSVQLFLFLSYTALFSLLVLLHLVSYIINPNLLDHLNCPGSLIYTIRVTCITCLHRFCTNCDPISHSSTIHILVSWLHALINFLLLVVTYL